MTTLKESFSSETTISEEDVSSESSSHKHSSPKKLKTFEDSLTPNSKTSGNSLANEDSITPNGSRSMCDTITPNSETSEDSLVHEDSTTSKSSRYSGHSSAHENSITPKSFENSEESSSSEDSLSPDEPYTPDNSVSPSEFLTSGESLSSSVEPSSPKVIPAESLPPKSSDKLPGEPLFVKHLNDVPCTSIVDKSSFEYDGGRNATKDVLFTAADHQQNQPQEGLSSSFVLSPSSQNNEKCAAKFLQKNQTYEDLFIYKIRTNSLEEVDYINNLPKKMLIYIFKFFSRSTLAKVALVCTRWYKIAMSRSLWKKVDLTDRTIPPYTIVKIVIRGCSAFRMERVKVESPMLFNDDDTFGIIHNNYVTSICKLEELVLSEVVIELKDLEKLLQICKRIKCLYLNFFELKESTLRIICSYPDLQVLALPQCVGVHKLSADRLGSFIAGFPELVYLNLALTKIDLEEMLTVCERLPKSLKWLDLYGSGFSLLDLHIYKLVKHAPSLIYLNIGFAFSITDEALLIISKNLKQLIHLAVRKCPRLSVGGFSKLKKLNNLKYLELHFNSAEIISAVRKRLSKVKVAS